MAPLLKLVSANTCTPAIVHPTISQTKVGIADTQRGYSKQQVVMQRLFDHSIWGMAMLCLFALSLLHTSTAQSYPSGAGYGSLRKAQSAPANTNSNSDESADAYKSVKKTPGNKRGARPSEQAQRKPDYARMQRCVPAQTFAHN